MRTLQTDGPNTLSSGSGHDNRTTRVPSGKTVNFLAVAKLFNQFSRSLPFSSRGTSRFFAVCFRVGKQCTSKPPPRNRNCGGDGVARLS